MEELDQCTYQKLNVNLLQILLSILVVLGMKARLLPMVGEYILCLRYTSPPGLHCHCHLFLVREMLFVGLIARFYFDLKCYVLFKLFSHILPF